MERDKVEFNRCTNCGAKIGALKNNFCTQCGIKLEIKPSGALPLSFKDKIIRNKKTILFSIAIIAVIAASASVTAFMVNRYLEFSQKNLSEENDDEEEDATIVEDLWEIDSVKTATYVIDGDTYDLNSSDRVRLADIDAPESGEAGYENSRNYLISLILNKKVYLDIDDKYRTDPYGRLVAVTYVRYNETHLVNVNKKMVNEGYATIWNCDNQFNPSTWALYIYYI